MAGAHDGEKRAVTLTKLGDTGRTVADPAQDVRGLTVVDSSGDAVGTVEDLLVDEGTGHVHFLRVEHGGLLGFGATPSLIPAGAVTRIDQEAVHIDRSRDRVADAPAYDPEISDRRDYGALYGYYGFTPFWLGDYVPPEAFRQRPPAGPPSGRHRR
jgi:sporulation protein YlmC with PRC-barrel domain